MSRQTTLSDGQINQDGSNSSKDVYHLEIDAETGQRNGLSDEKIKIYQVDAPLRAKIDKNRRF